MALKQLYVTCTEGVCTTSQQNQTACPGHGATERLTCTLLNQQYLQVRVARCGARQGSLHKHGGMGGGGGVLLSFLWFLAHLQDLSSSWVGEPRPQFLTANTFSEKGIYC